MSPRRAKQFAVSLGVVVCASGLAFAGCRGAPLDSVRYVGYVEPLEFVGGLLLLPCGLLLDLALLGKFGATVASLTLLNPFCNGIDYSHSEVGFLDDGVVTRAQVVQGDLDASPEQVVRDCAAWLRTEGWEVDEDSDGLETAWQARDQRHERVELEVDELEAGRSAFELRLGVAAERADWVDEGDTWRERARLGELRGEPGEDEDYDPEFMEGTELPEHAPPMHDDHWRNPHEAESQAEAPPAEDDTWDSEHLPWSEWKLLDRIFLRERELARKRIGEATVTDLEPLWEVLRARHGGARLGEE